MTTDEIIQTLQIAKAEVEWNYPLDYAIAMDESIKIIKATDDIVALTNMMIDKIENCEDRNLAIEIKKHIMADSKIKTNKLKHSSLCETETYVK